MLKIIGASDSGKTRKLLSECAKDEQALFVCAHPRRVPEKCHAYGLPVIEAIGYDEFLNSYRNDYDYLKNKNIYIDEVEKLFLDAGIIKGFTQTVEQGR